MRVLMNAACDDARRSPPRIAGRTGSPRASTKTLPGWPVNPRAPISPPASAATRARTSDAARHQSRGSCSTQPGRGDCVAYPSDAEATTAPVGSMATAWAPAVRRRDRAAALAGRGRWDSQLLRPVIAAIGRRIDHIVPAGIPGQDPTGGDADERRGERFGRVVDAAGAAKRRAAIADDNALRHIGRRPITAEDGVLRIDDTEARRIGIGTSRHSG